MADSSTPDLNQASYRPTQYADQEWEIVGEFKGDEMFHPEELEVVGGSSLVVDPMFADYGGLPPPAAKRMHSPMSKGMKSGKLPFANGKNVEEEAVDPRLKIAPEELEAKLAQAREEGRIEALTEAISHQQENMERLQAQINTVLSDMDTQIKERTYLLEQQAVELALEVSRKIIGEAVEINPEYILPIISEAIGKVGTATVRSVRVSPEDMEFINIIGIEKQLNDFDGTWTFQADPSIRSGCIVDTSAGEIDFQLDQAWERLSSKILSLRK